MREVAGLSEAEIRLLNIIKVSIVLHSACGDECSLTSRSGPYLLSSRNFKSTSLLNVLESPEIALIYNASVPIFRCQHVD
jgi:hypothetical protein